MSKEEFILELKKLKTGSNLIVNMTLHQVRKNISNLDMPLSTVKISNDSTMVIRVDKSSSSKNSETLSLIKNIKLCEPTVIKGREDYLRAIISKFSKSTGRKIKCKAVMGGLEVYEDELTRTELTVNELNDVVNYLKLRISNAKLKCQLARKQCLFIGAEHLEWDEDGFYYVETGEKVSMEGNTPEELEEIKYGK